MNARKLPPKKTKKTPMNRPISRRAALRKTARYTAAAVAAASLLPQWARAAETAPAQLKGRIHHSACRWCYEKIPLEDLCAAGREMGLTGIDLLQPADFPTLKKYGLVCPMVSFPTLDGLGGITRAWNRVEHHDKLIQAYEPQLRQTAAAGFERLICFSGNRAGLDDEQGLENCAIGLTRLLPLAEKLKVTLCMELLNSKRTHKDYQCDHVAWGAALVRRIGSERFKLLYDIYHMQIMEGDVCDTIRENHQYFDHYHTGGVPGRNELDETQELNYPRIMQEIVASGFQGFVAQEFVPKHKDALVSLRQAVNLCDV
jgi:hydroxypyruvate isomerase